MLDSMWALILPGAFSVWNMIIARTYYQGVPKELREAASVDGADEVNPRLEMIKGGGAALTREKIVAAVARKFVCIVDDSKTVDVLGRFPLPVEVIPMAREYVARELRKLGGNPVWRRDCVTDNGNQILDVHDLRITNPGELEQAINAIPGVVTVGIFSRRGADVLIVGTEDGVRVSEK